MRCRRLRSTASILLVWGFIILVSGCNFLPRFQKKYFESTTGMLFPQHYILVDYADNGEYVCIALLQLKRNDARKFMQDYTFRPVSENWFPPLLGLNLLDDENHQLPRDGVFFVNYKDKETGHTSWTYLLDTVSCRLWCEINYPDPGGD